MLKLLRDDLQDASRQRMMPNHYANEWKGLEGPEETEWRDWGARIKEGEGEGEERSKEEQPAKRREEQGDSELALSRTGGRTAIPGKSDHKHTHLCDCWYLIGCPCKSCFREAEGSGLCPVGRWGAGRVITNTHRAFPRAFCLLNANHNFWGGVLLAHFTDGETKTEWIRELPKVNQLQGAPYFMCSTSMLSWKKSQTAREEILVKMWIQRKETHKLVQPHVSWYNHM